MECLACKKKVAEPELLKCSGCAGHYHYACLNITSQSFAANYTNFKRNWLCPSCTNITKRRKTDDTPVKTSRNAGTAEVDMSFEDSNVEVPTPTAAATTTSTGITSPSNQPFTMDMLASLLDYKLLGIKSAITDFSSALAQIRSDIKSEISILSNRLDAVEHENAELRAKVDSLSHQPVASEDAIELREQVQQLQLELNDRDQASLQNDVELTHIPESVGESVGHVVLAVARKLGVALEERDVVSAGRVGAPRRVEADQPPRPRPIVVRFTRRALRDEIINSARVRRGADTSDLGLAPHTTQRFYVNERLTHKNRVLFGKARELGRTNRWRFIWTREGKIFAKKEESSTRYTIRTEKDLDRVFGSAHSKKSAQ